MMWRYTIAACVVIILMFGLVGCEAGPRVDTQTQTEQGIAGQEGMPNYITVVTDPSTKCEYLDRQGGGLTPRLGRGGLPICETTGLQ